MSAICAESAGLVHCGSQVQAIPLDTQYSMVFGVCLTSTDVYTVGIDTNKNLMIYVNDLEGDFVKRVLFAPNGNFANAIAAISANPYLGGVGIGIALQ